MSKLSKRWLFKEAFQHFPTRHNLCSNTFSEEFQQAVDALLDTLISVFLCFLCFPVSEVERRI